MSPIEFLGSAAVPAGAHDRSGLAGELEDGTPADRCGGFGSAIDWTGEGQRYLALSDRGPKDGATSFRCRWHELEIRVRPGAPTPVEIELVATTLLSDERGRPFRGSFETLVADEDHAVRLDPEALRVARDGKVWVSDEYGPALLEFDRNGRLQRALAVPDAFHCEHPDAKAKRELAANTRGRVPNRGFEGLALGASATDGPQRLFALLQGALIQDGGATGSVARLLEIDPRGGATRQFGVPLDDPRDGFNELLALAPGRFLALERDAGKGREQRKRRIVELDLGDAEDLSPRERLDSRTKFRAVGKRVVLDLLAFARENEALPDKIEGLCFGQDLADGRKLLLVSSDNDFLDDEPSWVWAFALDVRRLSR